MSFSDPAYVVEWQRTGRYPGIHDDIASFVATRAEPGCGILDLCSSTGLLGRQLVDAGFRVWATEGDAKAVAVGRDAGVYTEDMLPLWEHKLASTSMARLSFKLSANRTTAVVARRCLPELSESLPLGALMQTFRHAGVRDLFIEGRVPTARATHRLSRVEREIAACGPLYDLLFQRGRLAHLRARG